MVLRYFQFTYDEITKIAIIIISNFGVEQKWHRLIKPKRGIPQAISALTGITNDMVKDALSFEEIAHELLEILHPCVFVAHNARFDFGFIKNGFKRAGLSYQSPVLCTIKLLKQMYPGQAYYHLAYIAESFGITIQSHHRAQADVQILYQIIKQLSECHSWDLVLKQAKIIYQKSSIPSKLTTDITQIPDSPGVYFFYGDNNNLPLYIGKSITLRQRILSHFSGDYAHAKEFALSQRVSRIEVIPTAGELSALLLESKLIKKHMPIYNRKLRRKTTLVGFKLIEQNGYLVISIVKEKVEEEEDLKTYGIYGSFRSVTAAKRMLLQLIKTHGLCSKLCGMEHGKGACFSYQLKKCFGACIQEESSETYNKRMREALEEYQEKAWPYKGAIAVKEDCPINKITQFLLIHRWRYLGAVDSEHLLCEWQDNVTTEKSSTYDDYRIIYAYLKNPSAKENIIKLY